MRGRTILFCLSCLPALADCAPIVSSESRPLAARSRRDCGFAAAETRFWRQMRADVRSGNRRSDRSSFTATACAPPDADEIVLACTVREATPRSEDDAAPLPLVRVRGPTCAFANGAHSRAICSFEIAPPGDGRHWRRARANFIYHFGVVPDESGHPSYWSGWQAETGCGGEPARSSG